MHVPPSACHDTNVVVVYYCASELLIVNLPLPSEQLSISAFPWTVITLVTVQTVISWLPIDL